MTDTKATKQKFLNAIIRGTGETHLLIKEYPVIDFSNEIIKACLKNFAYDGQCESSRVPYLYELIALSGKQEKIKQAILKELAKDQKDTWTLVQLFELAKLFAQNGEEEAHTIIYNRFMKSSPNGSDWAGYAEILELDGLEGLKFIASKMGEALQNNPDDWQDDTIIKSLQDREPDLDVMQELEKASYDNSFIKTYMENVKKTMKNRANYVRKDIVYKNAVEEVLFTKNRTRIILKKWTKKELLTIANQLIIEKNKQNKEKLLLPFKKNKFPLDPGIILEIAKSHSSSEMSAVIFDVLGNLKRSDIREFAINGILNDAKPEKFIEVLRANYKRGNAKLLISLIDKTNDEILIESLLMDVINIYRFNKTKECKGPLEALYDKSNCAIHRADIIKILKDNNVLSDKIKNEIVFDCNEDIRKLADVSV